MTIYPAKDITVTIGGVTIPAIDLNYGEGPMTMFLDKHGTTINLGDICICHCGSSSCKPGEEFAVQLLERSGNYRKHMEVVRRADGTPVYRYKGGQDVRVGDTYACMMDVCGRSHKVDEQKLAGRDIEWSERTLIRRAGESEKPRKPCPHKDCEFDNGHLVDHPCGKRPRCSGCSKELAVFEEHIVALRGQDGRVHVAPGVWCLPCSTKEDERLNRPILGHDRNGREVRRGDRVRCFDSDFELVVEALSPDAPQYEACFHGHGRHILQKAAELVTDEKAEQTVCQHCGGDTGHSVRCLLVRGYIGSQGALNTPENQAAGDALESLCRALAQPTMGERFEAFKARMLPAISGSPFVEYCFDCSIKNGPTLLARCTKIPVEGDHLGGWAIAWNEQAKVESVCSQMDRWALVLGRAVLRGGK